MLISALIALFGPSDNSFKALSISCACSLICGLLSIKYTKPVNYIFTNEGLAIVLLAWITACFFGALPYIIYGGEFTLVNALFESMSGLTTTGASILNSVESLPNGIQFWRISSAWIGGIGVVLLVTLAIPDDPNGQVILVSTETSGLARQYFKGNKRGFVRMMMMTYTSITCISLLGLKISGMGWFDALLHSMSACSTCGFSNKNSSIAYFDSPMIETILIFSMLAGAVNFSLLHSTIIPAKRKKYHLYKSEIFRAFIFFLVLATLIVTINLKTHQTYSTIHESFRQAIFQTVSIATTTGYATVDTDVWPHISIGILIICSIICGCAGSTSGGIKVDRIVMIGKEVQHKIHLFRDPLLVQQSKMDGTIRKPAEIFQVGVFIILYFGLIFIGTEINLCAGMDLRSGVSAAIACIGNVGPGFGEVGSFGNYSSTPDTIKLSSIVLMLAGRLEIFPLFLAFRRRI